MLRVTAFIIPFFLFTQVHSQRLITGEEAVTMSLSNQRNLKASALNVRQQQELLATTADIQGPQVFAEATPYEPLTVGVQQTFGLPSLYKKRKATQRERIRLAELQFSGSQYELKMEVRAVYLTLQYLSERRNILNYQDSVYQVMKLSAKRFFDAGQINKLEELQTATQADQVRNELRKVEADLIAETQIFKFYTNLTDSFRVEPLEPYKFTSADSLTSNIQQQILRQQITLGERQLDAEKAELLPLIQAGASFPTTTQYERFVGYQVGVTVPIWRKQNRGRIAAAKTGIEKAKAEQELELQRLNARYMQALAIYQKELQSVNYFNATALPQARAIIETSQRLFQGGELNYIESLRNLQSAFDVLYSNVETRRSFNESVIQLNYLNGTL